jgi:hypothetical protein
LDDVLKISVWKLKQYLDQNESEKISFFGNNLIGEMIKAKINSGNFEKNILKSIIFCLFEFFLNNF